MSRTSKSSHGATGARGEEIPEGIDHGGTEGTENSQEPGVEQPAAGEEADSVLRGHAAQERSAPGEAEGAEERGAEVTAETEPTVENFRRVARARAIARGVQYFVALEHLLAEHPGLSEAIELSGRKVW